MLAHARCATQGGAAEPRRRTHPQVLSPTPQQRANTVAECRAAHWQLGVILPFHQALFVGVSAAEACLRQQQPFQRAWQICA